MCFLFVAPSVALQNEPQLKAETRAGCDNSTYYGKTTSVMIGIITTHLKRLFVYKQLTNGSAAGAGPRCWTKCLRCVGSFCTTWGQVGYVFTPSLLSYSSLHRVGARILLPFAWVMLYFIVFFVWFDLTVDWQWWSAQKLNFKCCLFRVLTPWCFALVHY